MIPLRGQYYEFMYSFLDEPFLYGKAYSIFKVTRVIVKGHSIILRVQSLKETGLKGKLKELWIKDNNKNRLRRIPDGNVLAELL